MPRVPPPRRGPIRNLRILSLLRKQLRRMPLPTFSEKGYTRLWGLSTKSTATISGSAETDTGFYAVQWQGKPVEVYQSGETFSETPIVDSSANALAVTNNGAAISTAQSKFGGSSGYFDGTGDYLQCGTIDLSSGSWTVELWFYATDVASYRSVVGFGGSPGFHIHQYGTGELHVNNNAASAIASAAETISASTWHHVAVQRDEVSGVVTAFLDGAVIGTTSQAFGVGAFQVGRAGDGTGGQEFQGYIDGLRIVAGTALYTGSSFPLPTSAPTAVTGTSLLLNFDAATKGKRAFEVYPVSQQGLAYAPAGQFDAFTLSNNSLVSLRAEDVALEAGSAAYTQTVYPYSYISSNPTEAGNIANNALSSQALDAFYTDLMAGGGDLFVQGNPGIDADDPTIATAKGYTVFGSVPPSTALLLNFNGTNGSTTFTDSSPNGLTATAIGSGEISTAQSKFGGSSLDATSGGVSIADPMDNIFSTANDFTIEFWIYYLGANDLYGRLFQCGDYPAADGWDISIVPDSSPAEIKLEHYNNGDLVAGGVLAANQWVHVAVTRASGSLRLFVDGSLIGTYSSAITLRDGDMQVGSNSTGNENVEALFDDIRLIKGFALYTANFTPPTSELEAYP